MTYGKFASAEELLKGYNQLEKSFTQKCQQLAALKAALDENGTKNTEKGTKNNEKGAMTVETDVTATATESSTYTLAESQNAPSHTVAEPKQKLPIEKIENFNDETTSATAATPISDTDTSITAATPIREADTSATAATSMNATDTSKIENKNETSKIATQFDSDAEVSRQGLPKLTESDSERASLSDADTPKTLADGAHSPKTLSDDTFVDDANSLETSPNDTHANSGAVDAKADNNPLVESTAPKTLASARDAATKLLQQNNTVSPDGTSVETPPSSAEQSTTVDSADTVPQSEPDAPVLDGHATAFFPTESQLQQYLLNNPKIAWQLLQQTSQPPQIMTGGGNVSLALPSRPKTIKEASLMAKQLFKN